MSRCREWVQSYGAADGAADCGGGPPAPRRTFARHWETRCEAKWVLAYRLFIGGIPCFFANLAIAAWLKFQKVRHKQSCHTAHSWHTLLLHTIAYMVYIHLNPICISTRTSL